MMDTPDTAELRDFVCNVYSNFFAASSTPSRRGVRGLRAENGGWGGRVGEKERKKYGRPPKFERLHGRRWRFDFISRDVDDDNVITFHLVPDE